MDDYCNHKIILNKDELAEDLVEIEMEDLEKLLEEEDEEEGEDDEQVPLDEPVIAINKHEGYYLSYF
jgi:hypothetical protein